MTLEVEKATAEKAAMSGQKQQDPARRQRQKDGMAQKQGIANKSNIVYASEDYFNDLRDQIERNKAKDAARVDWRSDLQEAQRERPQDEGNHPYVDVMPHTHKMPNAGTGKIKAQAAAKGIDTSLGESSKFTKSYKAPSVPGNRQDKDRQEKLNDFTAEKPPKGGKNYMKDEYIYEKTGPMEPDEKSRADYDKSVSKERKEIAKDPEKAKKYFGDPDFEGAREKQSIRQGRKLPNPSFSELKRRMGDSPRSRKPTEKIKAKVKNTIKKEEFSFDEAFSRLVDESALNPFQVHFDKDGKEYKDKGTKNQAARIAKNIRDNRKKGPMKQDPYKPRRGESD